LKNTDVWAVIPCYNDGKYLLDVVKKTRKYCGEVLVVNDGSTDNTLQVLEDQDVGVVSLDENKGKSHALKHGCAWAITLGAKNIVTLYADGQHDPDFIPLLLKELDRVDVVFGSRPRDKNMPGIRRFGNAVITNTLRFCFGLRVTDALSGYKAFKTSVFEKIRWDANGRYLVESDIFINVAKNKLRYSEVFVPTIYSDKGGITKTDGLKILWNIIKRKVIL